MLTKLTFGEFFRQKRIGLKKTMRQFCAESKLAPGNIRKLERGLMSPPQGSDKLEEYAGYLHIKKGTDDWYKFFYLAHIESVQISEELLEDEDVSASLPILFRTLLGKKISEKKTRQAGQADSQGIVYDQNPHSRRFPWKRIWILHGN
jgi:transcriptional regulator with XRE-family HTH domain